MPRFLINIMLILGLCGLAGIIAYASYQKFLYKPEPESEFKTEKSESIISDNTELQGCEYYYKYIFPNAPEYGSFEEYPITERYSGPIVDIALDSHAVAKEFYTYHQDALSRGVNFAGKYVISDWSFTSMGTMFAVIDAETGVVYPFPYIVDWDFDFHLDSNLIIINPKDSMPTFSPGGDISCDAKWYSDMKSYYYLFENGEFILLGPNDGFNLVSADHKY